MNKNICVLSEQENIDIYGGDKFTDSFGEAVGTIGGVIYNFLTYYGQIAQNSPITYG